VAVPRHDVVPVHESLEASWEFRSAWMR
jgi:hypothetical protein